jgi:transposase
MSPFIPVDRDTYYLLPPSVDDWLPENHLARFIVEVIDQLDLTKLTRNYAGRGSAAHHPSVLLGLLVYGYATGVFSSRKIERASYDSVAFRYIAANTHPDHDTLAHFRKTNLGELEDLFVQVLQLTQSMKLVKLGQIALYGTKVKANASKHKALSHGHLEKIEAQLRDKVQALLAKAETIDREAQADGVDLPVEIARQRAQATRSGAAGERSSQSDRRRVPHYAEASGFEQAYNAQAAVDAETMLVIATIVTQQPNDKQQVEPIVDILQTPQNPLGTIDMLLADNG